MRVLGIGARVELGDLYLSLLRDGHEVRVHASDPAYAASFDGLVERVPGAGKDGWRDALPWVGPGRPGAVREGGRRAPSRTRCGPRATR